MISSRCRSEVLSAPRSQNRDLGTMLNSQGRLDGVVHVETVNKFVNVDTLLANGVKKCARISGEDFADSRVSQHGVESADARGEIFRRTTSAGALNGFYGGADAIDRITNGVRKIAIEQQEFEDAIGGDVRSVDLAKGFKGGAAAQQADLLEILIA